MSRTVGFNIIDFDVVCGDKLYITDGQWETGNKLFDGCDDYLIQNPGKRFGESTVAEMTIRFYSDHIAWGHGFLLNFTIIQARVYNVNFTYP
mgnify:CR=1 FL=1